MLSGIIDASAAACSSATHRLPTARKKLDNRFFR
jgi:hypothetical protein